MSLVRSPKLTEKKVAANERNRNRSHGPATDEGRERIRAAHLRHGFYAQEEEVAMRALGEDPAQFQELLEGLWEECKPRGALQEGLVIRLARAMWLTNRADRMQEGCAVRQAQEVSSGREDRVHARMMRLKITAERLRLLAKSVECEQYVTTPADLEKMKNLHQEGVLKDMGEIALALFYQLQAPGTGEDGIDPDERGRRAVARLKGIFGLSSDVAPRPVKIASDFIPPQDCRQNAQASVALGVSPAPADPSPRSGQALKVCATQAEEKDKRNPNITAAEWEARERPRQLLENILKRQVERCEALRKSLLKESVKGPSPYERAAEIAPTHPNARLMRRMQDSNFREVRRLTNMLLKIKRQERRMDALEKGDEKRARVSRDVPENKGVIGGRRKISENPISFK
jgi:hypothetical protein